jgi:ABC-type transporter Mla maintaining outer membrane lipid asymmetry ATPase subunit MlaF
MKIQSLKFEGLVFGFESQDPLFNKVDFEFPMDQIVWTRASSGTGRSSLLQLMAGLQSPQFGKYYINEENVCEMSFEEFLPYRLNIGYGFDFGGLINNRTLIENVTLPLVYHNMLSPSQANEKMRKYFEILGASKFADQRPALVPGGIRKLVCLIRAIATSPDVLLLDDPSVGLGQETILKFFDIIQDLRNQGKCRHVFVNSFDEKLMSCLDHTEIFIEEGQIYKDLASDGMKKVVCL